ncbi:hypothetical protein Cgig2_003802 [Carnegiea gigantea]|uniref:Uncharacterized protein n=1 Tax=Carnegiea gigantea TaxID=171969 RepID=A0A9Q1QCG6_9CARY|nr:hypothetical protein Cgig2_003802 [Carnegiea gigantea]
MEAVNSATPLPIFDYVPTAGCEPSHRRAPARSKCRSDKVREIARPERDRRSRNGNRDRLANSATTSTPYATHSQHTAWFEEQEQTSKRREGVSWRRHTSKRRLARQCTCSPPTRGGHPMLRKLQPMITTSKPHNARKYCEFHEQNGHTIAECRELEKALYEVVNEGQIHQFLKKGS